MLKKRLAAASVFYFLVQMMAFQAQGATPPHLNPWTIETSFNLLYETQFAQARLQFLTWEKAHPQDLLGHAWEAASYLFEELYRQNILTSAYFLDDKQFLGGGKGTPRNERLVAFLTATRIAQNLARRLKINSQGTEALFGLTMFRVPETLRRFVSLQLQTTESQNYPAI